MLKETKHYKQNKKIIINIYLHIINVTSIVLTEVLTTIQAHNKLLI